MPRADLPDLRLRIIVDGPAPGVALRMQRGPTDRHDLSEPVTTTKAATVFEFAISVRDAAHDPPRFVGEFTQGPADGRFVYINVGTCAGQHDSPWTRRIKVPLYNIAPALVAKALKTPGAVLATRIRGTGKDGSPACATVPLLDPWQLAT